MAIDDGDILEYKDDGYIQLVLKIIGLMCDGQNRTLQVSPPGDASLSECMVSESFADSTDRTT